jgi:hypothetical protein
MALARSGVLGIALLVALAGCARPAVTPAGPSESATAPSEPADAPSDTASPAASGGAGIQIDLEAIRAALLGPSPVPEGWEDQVDDIMATLEEAAGSVRLPAVGGLAAEEAACATWTPLVGHQSWATGALLERQVFIAHLAQLAGVAPDAIRPDAEEALRVVSTAAAEQITPDGDPAVISRAPDDELRGIGLWALEHCELPVEAEDAPDTTDWDEEDIAYSCDLDRSSLERAMEDFRGGPGAGRYATHPHELEVSLEHFVYPAWHRIGSVHNEASPPTFSAEPIPGAFCER